MKKKTGTIATFAILLLVGSPLARAVDQCQFVLPGDGNWLVVVDEAIYRYGRNWLPRYNARRIFGPYTNVPYLSFTDGDPPLPCTLSPFIDDRLAFPFHLLARRPISQPPAVRPFFLDIDTGASIFAFLPSNCILSGICTRTASSAVVAAGAGLPNVFYTNYFLVTLVWM